MKAREGDWIDLAEGPGHPHLRRGLIVQVTRGDGRPPYRVRWLDSGRESLLFPPPDAHVHRGTAAFPGGGASGGR